MPDLVLTSDVIIGFPGETEAEAMETVELVRQVEFDALFTFIFSPRPGTPAAKMDDLVPRSEKQKWFDTLCAVQNDISARLHARYVGQTLRVLVDGRTTTRAGPYPPGRREDGWYYIWWATRTLWASTGRYASPTATPGRCSGKWYDPPSVKWKSFSPQLRSFALFNRFFHQIRSLSLISDRKR